MALQSKLLQLLQDGQFCRIGAQEDKKVEVRVVCATNRKLEEEIAAGNFRLVQQECACLLYTSRCV